MLPVKAWLYSKLTADTTLSGLVGGASHIVQYEPEEKTVFPLVILLKSNENDALYNDNAPIASDVTFDIEVYSKADASMATTTAIGIAISNILTPLLFGARSRDLSDPNPLVRHLHMEFRRSLIAGDLS